MTVELYSTRWGVFNFTEHIPRNAAGLLLPGAKPRIAVMGNNCFFLFQEFVEANIKIRICHFFSREKESFLLLAEPMTTFRFALSHSHQFHLPQLGYQRFYERNFNLLHIPHFLAEFCIGPHETYAFIDIILPDEYLRPFEEEFPAVSQFLKNRTKQLPSKLNPYPQVATTEIMRWIDVLIYREDTVCNPEQAVHNLVYAGLQVLRQNNAGKNIKLRQQEIEKIYEVADFLKHTGEVLSLQELANKFGISIYKLNKGFRQIYGHSVLHHRQEEKMRLALRLIQDKRYPIKQVAHMLDYWPQNFIRAFKHRFGYTPGRNEPDHSLIQTG